MTFRYNKMLLKNTFAMRLVSCLTQLRLALAASATLLLAGCSPSIIEITPTTVDADVLLLERGTLALEEEDWIRAREYFLQLRNNYPQSPLRADARLGVGDTFEGEGTEEAFPSALAEFRDFLALYPTHPRTDYAQYKIGMVYFKQMRIAQRDQAPTRNAIEEFELLIESYPSSPLVNEAIPRMREARDRLSESNYIVGRFYYRKGWYPGAIERFVEVLEQDKGYTQRDTVYFHLADSYRRIGQNNNALEFFERLLEEFPTTEHLKDATEYLKELKALPEG